MSDGPYREQALVLVEDPRVEVSPYRDAIATLGAPRPIVLEDEAPSPTTRLEVVDFDDGSTIVRLRGELAPLDDAYGKFALGWIACACVLSAMAHQPVIAAFSIAWAGLRRLAPSLMPTTEEISIGAHGLAWRRGLRRRLVSIDAARFELEPDSIALEGSSYFAALQRLTTPELAWLVGRLNRALDRAKR